MKFQLNSERHRERGGGGRDRERDAKGENKSKRERGWHRENKREGQRAFQELVF